MDPILQIKLTFRDWILPARGIRYHSESTECRITRSNTEAWYGGSASRHSIFMPTIWFPSRVMLLMKAAPGLKHELVASSPGFLRAPVSSLPTT